MDVMLVDTLDNRCPACGAKIEFNPLNQMWDCEYCASKFTLEEMKNYRNASSKENNQKEENEKVEAKSKEQPEKKREKLVVDVYRCCNCGAEIMADETVTATFCLYCGSTAILKSKIDDGRAPDLIIPFKTVKEDAVLAFKKLIKGKPLMPRAFRNVGNIEKIQGVYIPFWSYDLLADGNITFDALDVRSWSDSDYYYTETRRYLVEESGHFEYEKVLADASSRFTDDLMDSLEPFKYADLVSYNHAYLSGFLAEKYDIDEDKGLVRARERTMNTCEALLKSRVNHQTKMIKKNEMEIVSKKLHYIMLPVWILNIKYKDEMYTFAMNGQTGKIVGNIPVGVGKVLLWSFLIFIASFIILFAIYWLGANV